MEKQFEFVPLSEMISDETLGATVFFSMNALNEIVQKAAGVFAPDKPNQWHDKVSFGYRGTLGQTFKACIGFDARLWKERGEGPIWIEFDDPETIDELKNRFSSERERYSWLHDTNSLVDGIGVERQLVIPIPLKSGAKWDELLDCAIERISQVQEIIDSPQKGHA